MITQQEEERRTCSLQAEHHWFFLWLLQTEDSFWQTEYEIMTWFVSFNTYLSFLISQVLLKLTMVLQSVETNWTKWRLSSGSIKTLPYMATSHVQEKKMAAMCPLPVKWNGAKYPGYEEVRAGQLTKMNMRTYIRMIRTTYKPSADLLPLQWDTMSKVNQGIPDVRPKM